MTASAHNSPAHQPPATPAQPQPEITRHGVLSLQACIPAGFTDDQAIDFAQSAIPCGTTAGWQIRRQGDKLLAGCDERVQCAERPGCVHLMLDA